MDAVQAKYHQDLQNQLKIMCSATISALLDTHMFMFPANYRYRNQNTQVFLYTFYAIRQRTVISVRKLIEPSSSNKITLQSVVNLATKPGFYLLSDKEKAALSADFNNSFNSEHTKRIKNFRDVLCHNISNKEEIMCYYKDFMYIVDSAIWILEQLYLIAFKREAQFFREARDISLSISQNYWEAISNAAGEAANNNEANIRLGQLLSGKL